MRFGARSELDAQSESSIALRRRLLTSIGFAPEPNGFGYMSNAGGPATQAVLVTGEYSEF